MKQYPYVNENWYVYSMYQQYITVEELDRTFKGILFLELISIGHRFA